MIWLWGLWKSSLILRIGAGIAAIWAVWAGTYYMGQRKGAADREREIVDASKKAGERRNEDVRKIRRSIPRAGAWSRLRKEYSPTD
jgi:uncharacterized membrane protein YdjX (TVP38/TMEM64 family)